MHKIIIIYTYEELLNCFEVYTDIIDPWWVNNSQAPPDFLLGAEPGNGDSLQRSIP